MKLPILLLAAAALFALRLHAACGVNITRPITFHFPNVDNQGRVWLHQQLLTLDGDGGEKIPLHAYWSPDGTRPGSLLGEGWRVPLLESRCVQVDKGTMKIWHPDGYLREYDIVTDFRDGKEVWPKKLSGPGWNGEMTREGRVEVAASCGARLVFRRGRIMEMTVSGKSYTWIWNGDKLQEFRQGARTLLSLMRNFGTADKLEKINYAGGKIAEVVFGDVVSAENGKVVYKPGMTALKFSEGGMFSFDFKQVAAGVPAVKFPTTKPITWTPSNQQITNEGDWTYTLSITEKIEISRKNQTGIIEFYKKDPKSGIESKTDSNGAILTVKRYTSGPLAGKLRSREIKPKDGPEELLESYKYDINGEVLSGYSGTLKKSFNIVREKTKTTTYIDGSPHSIDEFDSSGKKRKTTWPSTNTTISFHYP